MKKIFVFLSILLVLTSFLLIPAFVASSYVPPSSLVPSIDFSISNEYVNALGDTKREIKFSNTWAVNELSSLQIWTNDIDSSWGDYKGNYNYQSDVINSPFVSGRIRPFGNDISLNIGSEVGSLVSGGYYLPTNVYFVDVPGTITYSFTVYDVNKTGGLLPPNGGYLNGYCYMFSIRRNDDGNNTQLAPDQFYISKRTAFAVRYTASYDEANYAMTYTCTFNAPAITLYKEPFLPLFTFRDLETHGVEVRIKPQTLTIYQNYSFQQSVLNDLDSLLNGTFDPKNWTPEQIGNSFNEIVDAMSDYANDKTNNIGDISKSSVDFIADHSDGLTFFTIFFRLIFQIDFIYSVCCLALVIGVFKVLFDVYGSIANKATKSKKK